MSLLARLTEKGIAHPPKFLPANMHYETIMGSVAYGVSADTSDLDVYGFAIPPRDVLFPHLRGELVGFGTHAPRFSQYQEHHLKDPEALNGAGREVDLTIYNIVDYFQLAMKNNPNMLDSLFTPDTCVLHITRVGQMVREARKLFLHKGCWHTYKGYAYAQLTKMTSQNRVGKRKEMVEQHGYDCYLDSETEFLTDGGWRKYDAVLDGDRLAVVEPSTGALGWEHPTERIDKLYTGPVYEVEPAMTRCVVTPNHHMLVSPARRSPATNFSYDYFPDKGQWSLVPFSSLNTGSRSWFHTRRRVELAERDFAGIEDDYLALAGLYLSEGTIDFRDGKVKAARFTQTTKGKPEFFKVADRLMAVFGLRKYDYSKETIWTVPRALAERLLADFGHGSAVKRIPDWRLRLSARQAQILWSHACLGDGTVALRGDVYYTSSCQLADDLQSMLTCAGVLCSVRGPYRCESNFGDCDVYQVYRPEDQYAYSCVDFKSRVLRWNEEKIETWPIKERLVSATRIVCFQVPSGTLITRSRGKVALHGNTKFAYHVVRLINEAEMILSEGDLDLMRNREQLKSIRRGEWKQEEIRDYFSRREVELEKLYQSSTLPHAPDEAKIKTLLLHCLEEHYGSLEHCIVDPDAAVAALREVQAVLEKYRNLL